MAIDSVTTLVQTLRQSQRPGRSPAGQFSKQSLVQELLQRGWLTPYQVNLLFAG